MLPIILFVGCVLTHRSVIANKGLTMDDRVVVYEADIAVYKQVLDVLYKADLHPDTVEDTSRIGLRGSMLC